MKNKALAIPLAISALLTGFAICPEAKAYSVYYNGRTAGNPSGQQLVDVGVDSRFDIGRVLDPTVFSLSAGTTNSDGDTLSESILGKAVMTVVNLQRDKLSLNVNVSNDTASNAADFKASIVSLWFGITQNISGGELAQGGVFDTMKVSQDGTNAPGGFKDISICIYGANNCSGGDVNEGLQAGDSDSFAIDIFGDFGVYDGDEYLYSSAVISDFGAKWQTSDGSYEVAGVPEPITVLGSGAALAFGAFMKRRSDKDKVKAGA